MLEQVPGQTSGPVKRGAHARAGKFADHTKLGGRADMPECRVAIQRQKKENQLEHQTAACPCSNEDYWYPGLH
ncbi:hypothetical protein GRJ2_003006400 [Grus japonensis]|uniref:Uncharacterized protein n=1 Tax=Grus japonensis TaxID=30415 RepID=A0ABC9Y610_GRUJA